MIPIIPKIRKLLNMAELYRYRKMYLHKRQQFQEIPSISFCTTCMGRLHHLKETLPANISSNSDYPRHDFILLDYNSSDGMGEWVKTELGTLLDSGKVKYFRVKDNYPYFHVSHAKNIVHKLATGDIVCNVDADNFTGKGFASYLAECFLENSNRVIHGSWELRAGSHGRIAVKRKNFSLVGGYDERMQGWGYEDLDLIKRLNYFGLDDLLISNINFLDLIEHSREEREKLRPPEHRNIEVTTKQNIALAMQSMENGYFIANRGVPWGQACVTMNFQTKIINV